MDHAVDYASLILSYFGQFFVDTKRHPRLASYAARHRGCAQIWFHQGTWIVCLILVVICAWTYITGASASNYPIVLLSFATFLAFLVGIVGEWALLTSRAVGSYLYMVFYYGSWVAMLWSSAMCYIDAPRGREHIQANWFLLQNNVIPFTTELETKLQFEANMVLCMGMGIFTSVWALLPLVELWDFLGGTLHQVQPRFGILFPELVVLLMLGITTTVFDGLAAQIAPWATPYGTSALLWQSACALFSLIVMLDAIIFSAAWGSTFIVHAFVGATFLPLAFIVTVTSSVTLARAQGIQAFVASNWGFLVYAAPPAYAPFLPGKYSTAAYFPSTAAGATGLMLALFLWFGAAMHLRCASVLLSVGPELAALANKPPTRPPRKRSSVSSRSSFGHSPWSTVSRVHGSFVPRLPTQYEAPELEEKDERSAAVAKRAVENVVASALTAPAGDDGAATPAGLMSPTDIARAAKEARDMDEYARLAAEGLEHDGHGHARQERSAVATRSRLFSIAPHLAADLDEAGIAKLVRVPSVAHFTRSALAEARNMLRAHPRLLLAVTVLSIGLIGGIIGGLTVLQEQGACGVLAAGHVERTVEVRPPVGYSLDLDADVFVANGWPRGSVEIVADQFAKDGPNVFRVEVTSFAPTDALLLSSAALEGAVQFSALAPPSFGDDPDGGYTKLNVVLNPPSSASTDCTMVRVRIFASNTVAAYTVRTSGAFVNFTGNFDQALSDPLETQNTAALLDVETDAGAIIVNSAYIQFKRRPKVSPAVKCNNAQGFLLLASSRSGEVFLTEVSAPGIFARTGGSIHANFIASAALAFCQAICADVVFETTGVGAIGVSRVFSANNANFTTDAGRIALNSATVAIARDMFVRSNTGTVSISNFLQLYGNRTFVSSAGPISASVVLGNQLFLEGREGAKVSVVEAFLGAPSPGALFKPPVVGNYSDPLLWAHTDRGDITILGFSSSPLSPTAAGRLSVDVASQLGSLKVEINGGGFSGSYSVTSLRGKSVVEIDGNNGPLSGMLGTSASSNTTNATVAVATFFTDAGDIQVSQMASPI